MPVIEIKDENEYFSFLNKSDKLVVADFYGEWCPPSINISSFLNDLSIKYSNVLFLKINIRFNENLCEKFNINACPTCILLKKSEEIKRIVGADRVLIQTSIEENFTTEKNFMKDEPIISISENSLLNATRPLECNQVELITVNGETGIWINREEALNWKNAIPISDYEINRDNSPNFISKENDAELEYDEEVAIKYLRPPTPSSLDEILIIEENNIPIEPAPPLIIRQQPARPETPPPLIIREKPPVKPVSLGKKIITIPGKPLEPTPRRVIIEKLPELPSKPQSVIVEKWLPYEPQKRKVIFQKNTVPDPIIEKPKNLIIQWQQPKIRTKKVYKDLGIFKTDPDEYEKKFGDSLISHHELFEEINDVFNLKNTSSLIELEGDFEALSLIDLEREGLGEYKSCIHSFIKSDSDVKKYVETEKVEIFCQHNENLDELIVTDAINEFQEKVKNEENFKTNFDYNFSSSENVKTTYFNNEETNINETEVLAHSSN